ncbi:metallophosphoesterase family protein [Frankia sp. R82]|uniref:purple acid phosphatase family protein n=1 Tax=Frankia sp. R82 TaxID=2950553 RepID=UPI0020446734|nr:metallophosphoesterase family protein [Frankia sp. R82]MCM3884509.1 metallophosphoesterase family protein [Frankia sp. R82]
MGTWRLPGRRSGPGPRPSSATSPAESAGRPAEARAETAEPKARTVEPLTETTGSGAAAATGPRGVHLTFGADPATTVVISWLAPPPNPDAADVPSVRYSPAPPQTVAAQTVAAQTVAAQCRSYRDARVDTVVHVCHGTLAGLRPDTTYTYTIVGSGEPSSDPVTGVAAAEAAAAGPGSGWFRTAPAGRAPFSFAFLADQGTNRPGDPFGSPAAGHTVAAIERQAPMFAVVGGDLSYANIRDDPVRSWADWFEMISASATSRPWMPCLGNHEIERGNGALGVAAYQTYFQLPDHGDESYLAGLWYAITVGSLRLVVLAADDVCLQDGSPVRLHGISAGRQTAWLARTLAQARADPAIDWIVVVMHQAMMSTSASHHGADLGIRAAWRPLFDQFDVDLVLHGHEHHYERSHPVRGHVPDSPMLTPLPVPAAVLTRSGDKAGGGPAGRGGPVGGDGPVGGGGRNDGGEGWDGEVVDATAGTVHLLVGTGGSSSPTAGNLLDPPAGRVIIDLRDPDPGRRRRRSIHAVEPADWLAFRAREHPYAFALIDLDPGEPGGTTSLRISILDSSSPDPSPVPIDRVTLVRPRADG